MPYAWEPTERYLSRSRLRAFAHANGHGDPASFHRWSVTDPDGFWRAVDKDLGLAWSRPYTSVLDSRHGVAWTTWWADGRINYVTSALRGAPGTSVAIIAEGEEGSVRTVTYAELTREVTRFAGGLRALGVTKGDRVGIFMPMTVDCVVAVLAVGAVGAIYMPIFSGYGPDAIAGRLRDCEASVLICSDGFYRRGQIVPMKETADAAVDAAPSVKRVIVARRVQRTFTRRERDVLWEEVMEGESIPGAIADTEAEDPYMLIYTSGTTGRPKGAVHVHGGFPIKAAQDLAHCFDLQRGDVIFWLTDIGWMMGPWLIAGGLMLGATIVLYDGTPDFPDASRLWSMVERHKVTHLGVSPTAIRSLMKSGEGPVRKHDLSSLFVLGSTGEPWNPDPWWWLFREIGGSRCPIINYSGGTEISGGIVGCSTWTPIQPASFSGPVPGIDADVVDDQGRSVRGTVGELVIRKPWPGMTRGFWKDRKRYIDTYWDRIEDVWVHGDWARVTDEGFWYIEGRSDDTLKIAGKRVGPAEVESAAVAHESVIEAAAVGLPHEIKGESIAVFAVLRPGTQRSDQLAGEIQDAVAASLGKPLRPDLVEFIDQLPKTRNGKVLRRVIRAAYLGQPDLGDVSALEDARPVEAIKDLGRRAR